MKKVTEEMKKRMIQMREDGKSLYSIAKSLGVGNGTVRYHLSRTKNGTARANVVSRKIEEEIDVLKRQNGLLAELVKSLLNDGIKST